MTSGPFSELQQNGSISVFDRGVHRCSSKLRNISWQLAIFRKKSKASNDVTAFMEYIINNVPYRRYCLGPFLAYGLSGSILTPPILCYASQAVLHPAEDSSCW